MAKKKKWHEKNDPAPVAKPAPVKSPEPEVIETAHGNRQLSSTVVEKK